MEARARKHRYKLIWSGYAVIAFGAWSIIRMFMMKYFDYSGFGEYFGVTDGTAETVNLLFGIMLFVLALDLLFRLYVGRNAVREGKGMKVKHRYVFFAALYTGVALISDFAYLLDLIRGRQTADMLSAVIIDITTSVAFIEIIVPSIALRRLGQATE